MNLVAVAYIWNQAPLATPLILADLHAIPENLYRAARIDGRSNHTIFQNHSAMATTDAIAGHDFNDY